MTYKIRYIPDLDSSIITNSIEPSPERMVEIQDWYNHIEKSILAEGLRNPVILTARNGILESRYGGTRIKIAQTHNIKIPAIIADFDEIFPDAETLETWEVPAKFKDKPKKILFKPYGINASGLPDTVEEFNKKVDK